jgi:hypothetical protein
MRRAKTNPAGPAALTGFIGPLLARQFEGPRDQCARESVSSRATNKDAPAGRLRSLGAPLSPLTLLHSPCVVSGLRDCFLVRVCNPARYDFAGFN